MVGEATKVEKSNGSLGCPFFYFVIALLTLGIMPFRDTELESTKNYAFILERVYS